MQCSWAVGLMHEASASGAGASAFKSQVHHSLPEWSRGEITASPISNAVDTNSKPFLRFISANFERKWHRKEIMHSLNFPQICHDTHSALNISSGGKCALANNAEQISSWRIHHRQRGLFWELNPGLSENHTTRPNSQI
eukprot:6157972-Amphidinium_carterae.2